MSRSSRCSIAVVVALVALSACSSSGESDGSIAPSPGDSVDSVRPNPLNGTAATFGQAEPIGDLQVTTSDPTIGTDDGGPWLSVTVRAENHSAGDVQTPQFELRCAGSNAGGSWRETSTFLPGSPVTSGSFAQGSVDLLLPGDDRNAQPRAACKIPATVVATLLVFDDAGAGAPVQKRLGWTVPDELIDQLNAAPQPT